MRIVLAVLLGLVTSAGAQVTPAPVPAQAKCAECGVVRSVKAINKEEKPTPADSTKPSGLVATIPFGKDAGPPQLGSSSKIGRDKVKVNTRWEVVVRLDDGRFQVVMLDDEPDLREGDKVRVDEGKVARRED
jgi:uncharacterized Zn finger protein